MSTDFSSIYINSDRLKADFDALAEIGSTGDGGVNRPTFSPAHLEARSWFREQVEASGLEFQLDGAANHSAVLRSNHAEARTLLLGSHLDSVPAGGRFDGALGVLAALEVLRTLREAGPSLPVNLEAIDFTDEEGTLVGLLGSTALAGKMTLEELESPRCGRQVFQEALERGGVTLDGILSARRDPASLAGYLELHVEQGPRLANPGVDIGVVSSIVGIASYRMIFTGRADHAGTTPMDSRQDAGLGASAFQLEARQIVMQQFPECVMNVGVVLYEPGAFNIVPVQAQLSLEFRSPDPEQFRRLETALLDQARRTAQEYGLGVIFEFLNRHQPAPLSQEVQQAIFSEAARLGLTAVSLPSGAGHDAQSLASLCPAGMIFVPSIGGASHSNREFTRWEDCLNGANVLLQTVLRIAG